MSTRPPHPMPAGPHPAVAAAGAAAGSKPRSSEGCWTCRLRRKKCDEARPVCQGCGLLEITCHYSDAKPEWMDGGPRQKEMADRVKLEVKRQANYRREKKYLAGLDADGSVSAHVICPQEAVTGGSGERASPSDEEERDGVFAMAGVTPSTAGGSNSTNQGMGSENDDSAFRMESVRSTVPVLTPPSSVSYADASPEAEPVATETDLLGFALPDRTTSDANDPNYTDDDNLLLLMTFLDYVFPFMFPFYRPPLFMGGRSWLLPLVRKNKALFHTALSLSSYFFTAVVESMGPHDIGGGPVCQKASLAELQRHQDLALRELQKDMSKVNRRGVHGFLRESAYVMESILQLLTFDLMIGNTANWQVHLEPASTLFEQILPAPEEWSAALRRLGHPEGRLYDRPEFVPWTSDQAGLRFYAADLLFVDTIASTALARAPRLSRYHAAMLEAPAHDVDAAVWENASLGSGGHNQPLPSHLVLDLSDFFGVMNWAVRLVGEIAGLDAWKKERRRAGELSVTELVARAAQVEAALRGGLGCLDHHFPLPPSDFPGTVEEVLAATSSTAGQATHPNEYQLEALKEALGASAGGFGGGSGSGRDGWRHQTASMADVATHTRIWAYAALTYLSVVVSGWQPGCPEIATSVARTTELLFRLRDPAALTTLVWPFCVAGCLVPPGQEVLYRALVERMGPLKVFGSTREALGIMEECWRMRERVEEGWDFAAAFSVKGHPALLI